MVILRSLVAGLVAVVLLVQPPVAFASVASGAATGRGVWTLTADGAAKLGLAESQVAAAVRVLGVLGKVSTAVTVGFAVYQVSTALWDWWQGTYDQGAAGTLGAPGLGTWGLQSGTANTFDCRYGELLDGVYYVISACSYSQWVAAGEWQLFYIDGGGRSIRDFYRVLLSVPSLTELAPNHIQTATGESGRAALVSAIDSAKTDLATTSQAELDFIALHQGIGTRTVGQLQSVLQAGRDVISNGVALTAGDVNLVAAGASTGTLPGAIPGTGESTTTDSGAATVAALAAVSAAIAASGAAVVSAVSTMSAAVSASIAASQAAVVSAVSAVTTAVEAIPTAIAASQAAVVSAVAAVVAPIVAAIGGSQSAVVDAIHAIPAGGGGAGATQAVDNLAAQEAARSAAADEEAAADTAPPVVCPICTRADKWSDAWTSLRDAGQAAPVFGLINRIVINPTGTIERVRTVQTTNFGLVSFDLSAWGIDTYIGVVRYVVIFASLMAGYFVIFG